MRKAGTRYERPCSASGTISRIVSRSAWRVVRFGSPTARRYSSISAADTTAQSNKRSVPAGSHRIATVPFTLRNLKDDLEDVGPKFDGAPALEFRLATDGLELEQSGLSYQRVPPGYRFPYGHTHKKQEEIFVVVRGSGRMKLDDEI